MKKTYIQYIMSLSSNIFMKKLLNNFNNFIEVCVLKNKNIY